MARTGFLLLASDVSNTDIDTNLYWSTDVGCVSVRLSRFKRQVLASEPFSATQAVHLPFFNQRFVRCESSRNRFWCKRVCFLGHGRGGGKKLRREGWRATAQLLNKILWYKALVSCTLCASAVFFFIVVRCEGCIHCSVRMTCRPR